MDAQNARKVKAWWLFLKMDSIPAGKLTPTVIEDTIWEAEQDLDKCDQRLAQEFEDYPQ